MGNRFTEYMGSVWSEARLCIKILVVSVAIFVLLQIAEVVSLYISVYSGGLETISGIIFLWCFWGSIILFFPLLILIPICAIIALINLDELANISLTIIAVIIAIASFSGRSYLRFNIKLKPGPDTTRCVSYNMCRVDRLKQLAIKLNQSKNDKDLVFIQHWPDKFLKLNSTDTMLFLKNGHFVLNSNLLDKKISQLSDNVVVIFESNIPYKKANIGGPNDISTWWHYGLGSLIVFGDGRIEFVKKENFKNLRWQP